MTLGGVAMVPESPRRQRRSAILLGLVVVVAVAAVGVVIAAGLAANSAVASNQPPALPRVGPVQRVNDADVGDPFILPVTTHARTGAPATTSYFLFWTTDWQSNVPMATSTDLVHWQSRPDALPVLPPWAEASNKMTWSPAVVARNGRYLMYVSTEEASSGRQCIALATAPGPYGPYADRSNHPFVCQHELGGSIDPAIIGDSAGHLHLLWKNDGNCCGQPTAIWEQKLSADGMHLVGNARRLLSADLAWQQGNIEAPAMIPAAGHGWWLFYSGNSWRSGDYATGLAFCAAVEGPCRETSQRPFLTTTPGLRTPGGLETFQDSQHRSWIAFTSTVLVPSRRNPARHYLNRVLDIAPLLPG